ncbi:MAG: caspase family protein [Saprospiraceae bacterium]|nr:caspase family protein [Saprospiraceae bacterium]
MDACRNTANIKSVKATNNNGIRSISLPSSVRGTLIAYATVSGNTASNGKSLGNSPYAIALAKYLTSKESIVNILSEVNGELRRITGDEQQAEFVTRLDGLFILNNE